MVMFLKDFLRDDTGLTTVEYAIAGGLVGAAVVSAFSLLGDQVARVMFDLVLYLQLVVIY